MQASSIFSAGTSVTSAVYSRVFSSRLSMKDSQAVRAVMVLPSLSLISTPPGVRAGLLGRPAGLERLPPSLPGCQYSS